MAAFTAKQIKIKLLCERAEKEDFLKEDLAAQGLTNKEIDEYIQNKRMEPHRKPQTTLPFEESTKSVTILNGTNIGLPNTHLVTTSTKDLMANVQRKFDKYKSLKKTEQELNLKDRTVEEKDKAAETILRKTQKAQKKVELDNAIKQQNFRDHMNEMYSGLDTLNKMPTASHYNEQFVFDNAMQDLCDHTNFDHHLLQNDLKWYNEAYVKYKSTMRK